MPSLKNIYRNYCLKKKQKKKNPMVKWSTPSTFGVSSITESCPTLCHPWTAACQASLSSSTPGACSNSCPLSWWCHTTISSSVILFSSCLQSFPVSGSFPMSQFFTSGGQSIGVPASVSVLPMNIQDWSPLGLTSWISLQSRGLSRVFSNTTIQKCKFFGSQLLSELSFDKPE